MDLGHLGPEYPAGDDDIGYDDKDDHDNEYLTILQAVLGILGSVLMTKAVCWVTPAKTMVIRSFQVIISYIIQVECFGTLPHVSDYFGAFLIMTGDPSDYQGDV